MKNLPPHNPTPPTTKPQRDRAARGNVMLAVAIGLASAAVVVFLIGMAAMAVSMMGWGDHMGMMGRGSSGANQTPVYSNAKEVTVQIRNYEFFSAKLTVRAGTEVTWLNLDSVPHDATDRTSGWSTGILNQNDSATLTFDTPGTYNYICTIHPNMKATLTVSDTG